MAVILGGAYEDADIEGMREVVLAAGVCAFYSYSKFYCLYAGRWMQLLDWLMADMN